MNVYDMSRIKLIATVSLVVIVITMMTSNQLPIYASPTTEDDGYTYPDDASDEEKEEIDEKEQEAWEDAGRPGEDDDNDDDGPNPYCDKVGPNYQGTCHDRKDYYQGGPNDGLYPCNDGTNMHDWRDCDYRADGSYPCSDGTYEVDLKACNIAARLKNNR
jgi:hypothetical protein